MNSKGFRDSYKVDEPILTSMWDKFEETFQKLDSEIVKSKETLSKVFDRRADCGDRVESCELCDVNEDYENLQQEVNLLRDNHDRIQAELRTISENDKQTNDVELLGRSMKEQNNILHQRLRRLEKTKVLDQKILKCLLKELERYQQNIGPIIDANTLEQTLEDRKAEEAGIEVEFNNEVQRLQRKFLDLYVPASKVRVKYEKIDSKLRTEINPRISKLSELLLGRKEKLEKVQAEISSLQNQRDEQNRIDNELSGAFEALKENFTELSVELIKNERDIRIMKKKGLETAAAIIESKKNSNDNLIDECENQLIADRVAEIHKDNLKAQTFETFDKAKSEVSADDCVIDELRRKICEMSKVIRGAEIHKARLLQDIDHLMGRNPVCFFGRDYLGSCFVAINLEETRRQ